MLKKISVFLLTLTILTVVLSACKNKDDSSETEITTIPAPTLISDEDSVKIGDIRNEIEEQVSVADTANKTATVSAFEQNITNSKLQAAAYNGVEDIVFSFDKYIDKTVSVKTTGSVIIDSPVNTVVLDDAKNGVTLNAKADTVIANGEGITIDVKSDTGSIYIEGKDIIVNVYSGTVDRICISNNTCIVVNHTENEFKVMLGANGTKMSVPAKYTYYTKINEALPTE